MLGRLLPQRPPTTELRDDPTVSFAQMLRWRGETSWVYSPMVVTVSRALTHAASSACIDVLASSVATLPLDVVRYGANKTRTVISPTPSLIDSPSALVAPDVWRYQVMDSLCTDGNAFGMVVSTDINGRPTTIETLDPDCVGDRKVKDGIPQAIVEGTLHRIYPYGDLWHMPGRLIRAGSPFAESPVRRAAATIGVGLAAREHGGRFFGDSGHPVQHMSVDKEITEEEARIYKAAMMNAIRGNREPLVTGTGVTIDALGAGDDGTQFIVLMQFIIEEACRFWRVPPTMVYAATSGQNVTYANIDAGDLGFLKYSLENYLTRFENSLTMLLPRPQIVKFNRNAWLRSDAKTRYQIYDIALKQSTKTVNEIRALEDEEAFPIDGDKDFDKPGIPGIAPTLTPAPGDTKAG